MMRRGKRLLEDLDREIREHIELETQKNIDRGMDPEQARYAAVRKFGNVTRVKEDAREVWIVVWLEQPLEDIRFAFRLLYKTPGYTIVAILTIALGIGVNSAIFSIFYATLIAPFPYLEPDQLVVVWSNIDGHRNTVSTAGYLDWKRESQAFQILGAVSGEQFNLSSGERPEVVEGSYLTPGFLDELIGDKPFLGRYVLPRRRSPARIMSSSSLTSFGNATSMAIPTSLAERFTSTANLKLSLVCSHRVSLTAWAGNWSCPWTSPPSRSTTIFTGWLYWGS